MVFGVLILVLGAFVLVAVSNPLEIAVYAGGPIMALAGLVFAIVSAIRKSGLAPVVFGVVAFLLGALLAVHDFLFPPGIAVLIHLSIAIATIVLGILQLARKKQYYARWFARAQA
ncbi:MAG: hypothetical protein WC876_03530 [Candidatus Thermoplasmatota archaeon]